MVFFGMVAVIVFRQTGLINGKFDLGLSGWTRATYGAEPNTGIDTGVTHGGFPSLRIASSQATDTAFGQDINVHPGTLYRLSAWIKTDHLEPHGAAVSGTFQAQRPGGSGVIASAPSLSGTHDWTKESVYFIGPDDGRARVALFLCGWGKGTGSVWFSNCELEALKEEELPMRITRNPLVPSRINPMQYGQFIEYLCDLVPSMWAEKLYDTSFDGLTSYKFRFIAETDFKEKAWYPFGQANRLKVELDHTSFVSGSVSKRIELSEGLPCEGGIAQDGISLNKGLACTFSVYVRGKPGLQRLKVQLFHQSETYASAVLPVTADWQKVSVNLVPTATVEQSTLSISLSGPGKYWLDNASLMPVKNVDGWRPDVVRVLKALKPGVIRVGGSVLDDANLGTFEWTDTIGPIEKRKPFQAWGGTQPMGAGLEEVVQLIQAVGAEPLICVRYEKKAPKDAADEVEYFNGAVTTKMGALRAHNGHPSPYNIRFWQVGNERWGEAYWKAVPEFCKAMLAVDPSIKLLSSFPSEPLIQMAAPYLSYVSPHQYDVEDLGGSKQELEDARAMIKTHGQGQPLKLAITEWNTTAGDVGLPRAKLWTLKNALDCSRYQNLLHREADLVEIANRSNLTNSFCSGIIQTNRSGLYLTPTYYAQYLYSNLAGVIPLKIESDLPADVSPDTSATLSADGKWLTIFAINESATPVSRKLDLSEFPKIGREAQVWTLADTKRAGEPDVVNSFIEPKRVIPTQSTLQTEGGTASYHFPPLSLTVIRWRVQS